MCFGGVIVLEKVRQWFNKGVLNRSTFSLSPFISFSLSPSLPLDLTSILLVPQMERVIHLQRAPPLLARGLVSVLMSVELSARPGNVLRSLYS